MKKNYFIFKTALLIAMLIISGRPLHALVFDSGVRVDIMGRVPVPRSFNPPKPAGFANLIAITAWLQPDGFGGNVLFGVYSDNQDYLRPNTYSLAVGGNWYVVNDGDAIDPTLVNTGTPFFNTHTPDFTSKLKLAIGDEFMFGFWLDADMNHTPSVRDCYGWATLKRTPDGLELIGSGIDNSGVGIIAGTLLIVPEPSTVALLGFALLSVALRRLLHVRNWRGFKPPGSADTA